MDAKGLFDDFDDFDEELLEGEDTEGENAEDVELQLKDTEGVELPGTGDPLELSDAMFGSDESLFDEFEESEEDEVQIEEEQPTEIERQTDSSEDVLNDNMFTAFEEQGSEEEPYTLDDNTSEGLFETDTSSLSEALADVSTLETENDFEFDSTDVESEESEQPAFGADNGILGELNAEGEWLTGANLEDKTASEVILSDTVDKNSFEGLFVSAKVPQQKTNSSVLEAGAMSSEAFSLKYLTIQQIIVWSPRIRKNTDVTALVTSIKNDGLLQPLVVAPTQTEGRYVLIKGARRLLACVTLGMKTVPCIVNSQITISDIHVVEPLYSHTKPYTVSDMLAYIDYLKTEKNITAPSMIEYLLNLNSGDFMKLMDVMDDNDDEIVGPLLTGQIDIGGAFKKLEQKRKKMGKEKMSNARTEKIYGDAATYGADVLAESGETNMGDDVGLSEAEMKSIIDGMGSLEDVSSDDGEELRKQGDSIKGFEAHKQDPNERERLDPKLRKAVLARDNNTCQICHMGGQEYGEVLDVHHICEVYLGGSDDINNLLTACTCCHKLIHLWGRSELSVRPFDQMDEAEATKFKRIIKLGNVIRQGMAAKGMKKEQLKKLDQADTIGRRLKGSSDQVAG